MTLSQHLSQSFLYMIRLRGSSIGKELSVVAPKPWREWLISHESEGVRPARKQNASLNPMEILEAFTLQIDSRDWMGCWPWIGAGGRYGAFSVKRRLLQAHYLAKRLWCGELGEYQHLRHICGNPRCCNPDHIIPGSAQENQEDAFHHGTRTHVKEYGKTKPCMACGKPVRKYGNNACKFCDWDCFISYRRHKRDPNIDELAQT